MRSNRLVSIMLLLQSRDRVSASELARRLEVSVRTIMRDVDALSMAGVPVYALRGPNGGIALLQNFNTDLTGLTTDESRALFVLLSGTAHTDLGLRQALGSALRKLMAAIPASQRPDAELIRRRILIEPERWGARRASTSDLGCLTDIQAAVFDDVRLQIRYRHGRDGSTRTYLLDPYGLVNKAGVWYLVADHDGQPRMFRVERVLSTEASAEPVRRREGVELEAIWNGLRDDFEEMPKPVDVTVRVAAQTLPLFLRIYARELAPVREGSALAVPLDGEWATLELRFGSILGAQPLLGFGPDVEVVAPESVRIAMAEVARKTADMYR